MVDFSELDRRLEALKASRGAPAGPSDGRAPVSKEDGPLASSSDTDHGPIRQFAAKYGPWLAVGGALLHKPIRSGIAKGISKVGGEGLVEKTQKTGRELQATFAPTSVSDEGVSQAPGTVGVPGGKAGLARGLGTPSLRRMDTTAQEAEAIAREHTGVMGAFRNFVERRAEKGQKYTSVKGGNATEQQALELHYNSDAKNPSFRYASPEQIRELDAAKGMFREQSKIYQDVFRRQSKRMADPQGFFDKKMKKADTERMDADFYENYFMHIWEHPSGNAVPNFTKARKFPTSAEAMDAGWKPKYLDIWEHTQMSVAAVTHWAAKNNLFNELASQGQVRWFRASEMAHVPEGWTKVEGYIGRMPNKQAYMPDPAARIFNNMISKSWNSETLNNFNLVFNNVKAGAFAGAQYHAMTTAVQAVAGDMQRAIKLIAGGKPGEGLTRAAKALSAPYLYAKKGREMQLLRRTEKSWANVSPVTGRLARLEDFSKPWKDYLKPSKSHAAGTEEDLLDEIYARTGGHTDPYKQATEYHFSREGSYRDSWKKGILKMQLLADARGIQNNPLKGAGVVIKHVGRLLDTIAEPTLHYYVPWVKNGAYYGRMKDWLLLNPNASYKQLFKASRDIVDSIDNRYGEMIHDNVFWNKQWKAAGQIAMVSWSYELGTLREVGGAIHDLAKGVISSERVAYLIAMPIAYSLLSTIFQTLHTGKPPDNPLDLIAPRTGGTDPKTGKPERMYPVGDMKEPAHLIEDPYTWAGSKLAPGPTAMLQYLGNYDWRGNPIRDPNSQTPALDMLTTFFTHFAAAGTPIWLDTKYGPDSGFNFPEKFFGMRPAGMDLTDPEKSQQLKRIREEKGWRKKQRADKREEALREQREKYYGERHATGGIE